MTTEVRSTEQVTHVHQQTGGPAARPVSSNYFRRHKLVTSIIFVIILITLFGLSGAHFGSTAGHLDQARAAAQSTAQDRSWAMPSASSTLVDSLGFGVIQVPSFSWPPFPIIGTVP